MLFWKSLISHIIILSMLGCNSTSRMTGLGLSMVHKQITPNRNGGVAIQLDGYSLVNPTLAVEVFHTVAEQQMNGRPYRYSYSLGKKQTTLWPKKPGSPQNKGSSKPNSTNHSHHNVFIPIYSPPAIGGGHGGGEAAVVLGTIALILIIAKLASENKKQKTAASDPSCQTAATTPIADDFAETPGGLRALTVSGNADPISPVTLNRSRIVEVLTPEQPPVIGQLKPEVAASITEKVRKSFAEMGCPTRVGNIPGQQGYKVTTTVLRAQGNLMSYSALTLEITVVDEVTQKQLACWLVQAIEKPFNSEAQNERLHGPGIATTILEKPLQTQITRYFR